MTVSGLEDPAALEGGVQLVICDDPRFIPQTHSSIGRPFDPLDPLSEPTYRTTFEGTIYEGPYLRDVPVSGADDSMERPARKALLHPQEGVIVVSLHSKERHYSYFPIPPGERVPFLKINGVIAPDAPEGPSGKVTVSLRLSNGPDGQGVLPPYGLKNELTYRGEAGFLSVLPRRISGRADIVDDIAFFVRGDANSDGTVDISDAISVLGFLFLGGLAPNCPDAADADDSGTQDITDAVAEELRRQSGEDLHRGREVRPPLGDQAKVDENGAPARVLGRDEVARMDVQVKDPVRVEVVERVEEVQDRPQEPAGRLRARRPRRKRGAVDVLAGVEGKGSLLGVAEVVGGGDLRVMQAGDRLELLLELRDGLLGETVPAEDLESHEALRDSIVSQVDRPRAPRAELPSDRVPVEDDPVLEVLDGG